MGRSGPSGRSGRKLSKFERGEFVAWDSEGANVKGRHSMICLANNRDEPLLAASGIGTIEALEYVAEGLSRHSQAIHCAFVFSYDVNMMLGDMPPHAVRQLWDTGKVSWKQFRIEYIPRKTFGLWAYGEGGIIWDIFGFCQSSFVEALKKYRVGTAEQVERIQAMKWQRSQFKAKDLKQIAAYCQEECELLADGLAPAIRDSFEAADIKLTRWDGAGAAAAALLKRERVQDHLAPLPPPVEEAARHAYFGGRIECGMYGNEPDVRVYGYDINSAYPAAALQLPSLEDGIWQHCQSHFWPGFGVWRLRWEFDEDHLLPLPWRNRLGSIYFPTIGEGWYWAPEAEAALKYAERMGAFVEVIEGWVLHRESDFRPFAFLQHEYERRQKWKAEGNGAEKAAKLAINSVYGKLAQQVGGAPGQAPRWHNLAWAGWITATTRAALWNAAQQSPENVIMLATDAIYSKVPLDLPLGTQLGQWESEQYTGATIVQSGVYWLGDGEKPKGSRGFDLRSLNRSAIISAWAAGEKEYPARHTAFVGMGEASARNAWKEWRTWQDRPRLLGLTPDGTKRYVEKHSRTVARKLVATLPVTPLGSWMMSYPIVRPWDDGEATREVYDAQRRQEMENESWAQ